MKQKTTHTLILALGNWYQQDDAIALVVLERLKKHFQPPIVLHATEESGLSLLEYIVGYQQVILLDALITEQEEGKVLVLSLDDFQVHAAAAWHQMGIPEVFQLGYELKLPMPQLTYLLGITVNHCHWGTEGICSHLCQKLPQLERTCVSMIRRLLSKVHKHNISDVK